MDTAVVSIMCIALIVVGGMTMSQGFISSADTVTLGVEALSVRDGEINRTELTLLTTALSANRKTLEVALRNSGQVKLASFDRWDVIVQYYDSGASYVKWLPYVTEIVGDDQWTKQGIYLHAENQTPEVFEPGILNPGEEMVIEAELNPRVGKETTNDVIISTPNGVLASISFTVP